MQLTAMWARHTPHMLFVGRFVCFEDRDWFGKAVSRVIQEHVDPGLIPQLHPEPYFVDFLRDAPEPTGEERDDACFDAPKIYELVSPSQPFMLCTDVKLTRHQI